MAKFFAGCIRSKPSMCCSQSKDEKPNLTVWDKLNVKRHEQGN